MDELIFCLMGPTASGKTALACELVQQFPLEIISVDSAMIYRGMDIGTAKPDAQTLAKAPHHLIDILDPIESYSAAQFCSDVNALCETIRKTGKYPLLVGGTMMYFRALQQGLSLLPPSNVDVRKSLQNKAEVQGWEYMHQSLTQIDPKSALRIHPNDTQRILRALEVYELSRKPLSDFLDEEIENPPRQFINLLLMPKDRKWLHHRIALRFKQMLQEGFIEEVTHLVQQWSLTAMHPSMRSVGYRQVLAYLNGEYEYAVLEDKGIAATRQLAKRQLTWLRHWPEGQIYEAESSFVLSELIAIVRKILDNCDK
jgi:tRNA dimethylallyltransferase